MIPGKSPQETFNHLLATINSERFLKMQGLGNEIPFFICPYPPEEAVEMERLGRSLLRQLEKNGVHVCKVNLYDLCIELLKQRGIWESILETETGISKAELKELLQNVLDPETHLMPAIAERVAAAKPCDVVFITGVGEIFPYIRSHTILNNLQSVIKHCPVVMFFPGKYEQSAETGSKLVLFGKMQDDRYYRAFNIYHFQL